MKLSIVIPAHNEQDNIRACLHDLHEAVVIGARLPCQIIVVNDNSNDETAERVTDFALAHPDLELQLINRAPPAGFGRAVRAGLEAVTGDAVVIYMADRSDDPHDVLLYYRKLEEGYDCVFGSRFVRGSTVTDYPRVKLIVNRLVNWFMQLLFWTRFNDLTNAFKAYRTYVIHDGGPFYSSQFNITIEMSLAALIRRYQIAQVPISWHGRTWGSSHLRLRQMGRKYLCVLLKVLAERWLISDDLLAEKLAHNRRYERTIDAVNQRLRVLEQRLEQVEH
jgi:dolichol-phosphate mannosyltransferase